MSLETGSASCDLKSQEAVQDLQHGSYYGILGFYWGYIGSNIPQYNPNANVTPKSSNSNAIKNTLKLNDTPETQDGNVSYGFLLTLESHREGI